MIVETPNAIPLWQVLLLGLVLLAVVGAAVAALVALVTARRRDE